MRVRQNQVAEVTQQQSSLTRSVVCKELTQLHAGVRQNQPLSRWVQDGDVSQIERFVLEGVDINVSNEYGRTALHFAVASG